MATIVMATTSSISVTPRCRCMAYLRLHEAGAGSIVIVRVPTVIVVPGLAVSRPWSSNWKVPVGLAAMPEGAVSAIAAPSAPSTGVDQLVSPGLQLLPAAACWLGCTTSR